MGGATYSICSVTFKFFSPPYAHNLKQKCKKKQAACTTKRLIAKREGKKRKIRGWSDCSVASDFSLCFTVPAQKMFRVGFIRTSSEVPSRSPVSQNTGPGTLVGEHAGAGGGWVFFHHGCCYY